MPDASGTRCVTRLWEFSLSLHPDKTRLIEFGRLAAARRARRGLGKPETFDFLGFTFICGKSRQGNFLLRGRPGATACGRSSGRSRRSCGGGCISRSPSRGRWLRQVVTGFFAYHAVPTNGRALAAFRHHVGGHLAPHAATTQPAGPDVMGSGPGSWRTTGFPNRESFIPGQASASPSNTRGGSRMRESRTYGSVRGALSNERPYRDYEPHKLRWMLTGKSSDLFAAVFRGCNDRRAAAWPGRRF